ncbi:MAG: TetR/AcrR family transcriptional regulator [Mycobacterium sp.]|nr:TetR/AcrR family transcriptional regulator [Mycobacterium sp.]
MLEQQSPITEPDVKGHRQRLLDAMAKCIVNTGFARATVADVVRVAATSRRTFYQHFGDLEDCLMALYSESVQTIIKAIRRAIDPDAPGDEQIRAAVQAWIDACDEQPALTSALTRDFAGLGPKSWALHFQLAEDYRDLIQHLTDTKQLHAPDPAQTSSLRIVMLLGALNELLTFTVHQGIPLQDMADEAVAVATVMLGTPRQG